MLSGRPLRRLLGLRERIRTAAVLLGPSDRRRLLAAMEAVRRQKPGPRDPLREVTGGEALRQIKWLTGSMSLEEAEAVAEALERIRREARQRAR